MVIVFEVGIRIGKVAYKNNVIRIIYVDKLDGARSGSHSVSDVKSNII